MSRYHLSGAVCTLLFATIAISCQADPGYDGRTSQEWIAQLRDGDVTARQDAVGALSYVLSVNPKLNPPFRALVFALSDTSDAVRVAASRALSQSGVKATDALPGLVRMLDDSAHADVRVQSVRTIARLLAVSSKQPSHDARSLT